MLNERNDSDMAIDMVSIVAGVALFLSPWLFGFAAEAAASWNAWMVGLLIAIVGVWTMTNYESWEEWLNLALGVWTLVSPWLLGFAALGAAGEQPADPRAGVRLAHHQGGARALVLGHGAELVVRVVGEPLGVTVGGTSADGGHDREGGQGS